MMGTKDLEKKEKKVVAHVWKDCGADAGAWCQDCTHPTSERRHLERAGHHIYVCLACAKSRLKEKPLRLKEAANADR